MSLVQDFYSAIAQDSADKWYSNPILQPTIDEFMSLLPEAPSVLDLGCGAGYESRRLSESGARVVGVDFTEEVLRIATRKNPQCEFHLLDFREIPSGLGAFHGVFASASLIHVSPDELVSVLRGIDPLLEDPGVFLAILKQGEGYTEGWVEIYGKELLGSHYGYDPSLAREIFEQCGYVQLQRGYLDENLVQEGWFCLIFKRA